MSNIFKIVKDNFVLCWVISQFFTIKFTILNKCSHFHEVNTITYLFVIDRNEYYFLLFVIFSWTTNVSFALFMITKMAEQSSVLYIFPTKLEYTMFNICLKVNVTLFYHTFLINLKRYTSVVIYFVGILLVYFLPRIPCVFLNLYMARLM